MADQFPMHELRTRRRIEFADTDMGGIVHFSRYFVFMETAEHQFLEAVGTPVHFEEDDGRAIGWPRVEAQCRWISPARLGDEIEIHVRVARKGTRSMTYDVEFRCGDRLLAEGRMSSVCCVLNDPAGLKSIPIPDQIAERIAEAP